MAREIISVEDAQMLDDKIALTHSDAFDHLEEVRALLSKAERIEADARKRRADSIWLSDEAKAYWNQPTWKQWWLLLTGQVNHLLWDKDKYGE